MKSETEDEISKGAMINPDPFCPVRLSRVLNDGRGTDKFMVELQKPDSEAWTDIPGTAVVHSRNYRLVSNKQVHDMARAVMDQTKLRFEVLSGRPHGKNQHLVWNGKQYIERWYTPDVNIKSPQGSDMMLGMEVRNSYDKSCKVGLAFFAMHCKCSNQFFGRNLMGAPFNFSHIGADGELEDDFEGAFDAVQQQAETFGRIVPTFKLMAETPFIRESQDPMGELIHLRDRMEKATGLEFRVDKIMDELSGRGITSKLGITTKVDGDDLPTYGNTSTYWALANAMTAITTHVVGGVRGQEQAERAIDFLIADVKRVKAA